jgi:cyanophycinase
MRAVRLPWGLALALLPALSSAAEPRLVLIGGGPRPSAALARFAEWAGGARARILVVTWAARDPAEAFEAFRKDLAPYTSGAVHSAPVAPLNAEAKARLRDLLAWASAVYFTGGDQDRIMDELSDRSLLEHMRARYQEGVVFAGTSAGTAVMSSIAITGDGDRTVMDGDVVEVRPGIGLLPGVVLDQHFIRRQRQNRLFGLVLKHPRLLGVGVDEGTAVLVRENRYAEVVGASRVMLVEASGDGGELRLQLLSPGETFDLSARRRGRVARLAAAESRAACEPLPGDESADNASAVPCAPAAGPRRDGRQ